MNYRTLIVLATGGVCGLSLWMSFYAPTLSAQSNGSAPPVPVYNPYPPGILPRDLSSEITRVLREVDFVESRAITRWHNLKPPILTGQPPVLQNTGTEATETLGELMMFDKNTGGTITGTIAAVDKILSLAGNDTKIVSGHGPLGSQADLTKFRDMLVTSRDRVQKLKSAGKLAQKAEAEKPFADLDPVWGKASSTATSGSKSFI